MDTERQRFHPSVLFVYFIRDIRKWLFVFFILLVDLDSVGLYTVLGLSALTGLVILKSFISYLTHKYHISPEKIVVYKGIFKKKETVITYDRIQTVKQRQWFFFKPFNVVEVLIETAGSSPGEAEASLTAVDYALIETIEGYRNKTSAKENKESEPIESSDTRFTLTSKEIVLYALTDVTVIFVLGTAFTFALEWLPESIYSELGSLLTYFRSVLGFLLIFIGVGLIGALSLIKNFILFHDFQASLDAETLTIEYGLFERKIQKIPLAKIQGIRLHKQLFRQVFKRSSVELIIMGGQEKEGGNIQKVYLFPLIRHDKVYGELKQFLPNITVQEPIIQHVSTDKLWYFWRWILLFGIPIVIISFVFNDLIGFGLLAVLILSLGLAWKKSRVQGYSLQDPRLLCLQNFQGLSIVQLFIAQKNIQAFTQSTTLWLAKKDMGHLNISFKDGELPMAFDLQFISQSDLTQIYEKFWNSTPVTD